ncbi:MAG: glycosyltransferase family 9 protein, partial [Rhodospirillaceae bacterium]|nr:glycosyltransferase family 9 protein [Rhodospirillaceae bacterium]
MSSVPQKVLIHRLGSLGDTAFLMPIFHHLNEVFPDAEKRVLTNFPVAAAAPPLQAVLGDGAFADGYFAYPIGSRNPAALWRLAR